MTASLEVRALGQLTIEVDGQEVELGKGNERLLVALLALNAGKPVSLEWIVDTLWPDDPPPTAREMVRIYVGRVRKRLGENAIRTRPGGYALDTESEAVDVLRFERLCKAASRDLHEGDASGALAVLEQALALWQGPPLPELGALPFVREERARLDELHLAAVEDRIDAELELGRAGELVAELESLVRDQPHRERRRCQLMLALYRSGRQTEALAHYQDARRLLVDEFGVEPGPELQALQKAILTQDPSLSAHSGTRPGAAATAPKRAGRQHRRLAAGLSAAAAVAAAAVVVALVVQGTPSTVAIGRDSISAVDTQTGAVVKSLHLGGLPGPVAVDSARVWLGDGRLRRLQELDARRLRTLRTIGLPDFPEAIVTGFGAAWVANGYNGTIVRIDAEHGDSRVFRPEPNAHGRVALATGYGGLWAASQDGVLVRLDPRSLAATTRIGGLASPSAIATGLGGVWVADATRDELVRVDPLKNRIAHTIPIGGTAADVAVGNGSVWAVTPLEGRLWRIDPRTNAVVASIAAGPKPLTVAATPGSVWVGSADGTLSEVDPNRNRVVRTIRTGGPVAGLAALRNRVWVTVR